MRLNIFGEAMVEFDSSFNRSIAGDTLNVAAVASRLGADVTYFMKIGKDIFYSDFQKIFEEIELETVFLEVEGQNGLYFIKNSENGERHFQYYRANSAASKLSYQDLPSSFYECDMIFNSGITAAISDNCREAVLHTFTEAKNRGIKTAFDCNYRSALWSVEEARRFLKSLVSFTDILFLSEDDLEVSRGIEHPFQILRKGAQGSEVILNGESKTYFSDPVEAIDTTGAGDAYAGAFLIEYLKSNDIGKAAKLASRIASQQVQVKGGLPSSEIRYV